MKFLLSEKYQLSEKFNLNETLSSIAIQSINKIISELNNLQKYILNRLQDYKNNSQGQALKALEVDKKAVESVINNKAEYAILQAKIAKYLKNLSVYIKALDNHSTKYNDIKDLINKLTEATGKIKSNSAGSEAATEASYNYIVTNFKQLTDLVQKAFDELNTKKLDDNLIAALQSNLNKIIELFNSCADPETDLAKKLTDQNIAEIIDLTKQQLSQKNFPEKTFLEAKPIEYFEKISEIFETLTTELDSKIEQYNLDQAAKELDSPDADIKGERNWKQELLKATQAGDTNKIENIWKAFYASLWKNKVHQEAAKKLGHTLLIELNKFGYTKDNPFVKYLTSLFSKGIIPKSNIYDLIHNAVANDKISVDNLIGKGFLENNNIIFNSDFYAKSSNEASEYLKLWNKAEDYFKKLIANPIIQKRYSEHKDQFYTDVFFAPGNSIASKDTPGDVNGKLKDLTRIATELNKISTHSEEELDKDKQEIDSGSTKNILAAINNKTTAADAIKYLIITYGGDKATELLKKYPLDSNNFDLSKTDNFAKFFDKFDINLKNLDSLLNEIYEKKFKTSGNK